MGALRPRPAPSRVKGPAKSRPTTAKALPLAPSNLRGEWSHQWRIRPRVHLSADQAATGDLRQEDVESQDDIASLKL
jgi:hypothetical protein